MIYKTKPYAHQIKALKFCLEKRTCGLFMEMGTGKTKVAIDWIVNAGFRKVAVIGRKDDCLTWRDELRLHSDLSFVNVIKYQQKEKRVARLGRKARVYILSYDSVKQLSSQLWGMEWDAVILDECNAIKHHNTQRTKTVLRLFGNVPNRLALTGTPITNSIEDVFSQMQFIDGGKSFGRSFWTFRQRYFFQVGYEWIPYKTTKERIREKMYTHAIRLRKSECLQLPPKLYLQQKCGLSPQQEKIYRRLKTDFELLLQDGTSLDLLYTIQQFTKLLQVSGSFYYSPDGAVTLPGGKLSALHDLLDLQEFRNKSKIVIWANFNHEIRMIRNVLRKLNYRFVTFWKKTKDREATRKAFALNKKVQVFVGQVRMGIGINELKVADTAIYYSRSLKLADRMQSEDRIHRAGSERHKVITYIDLITEGTVDEQVYKNLRQARDVASMITDGQKLRTLIGEKIVKPM